MEDRRNDGESSCNFGDGTDQRVQSLMFMVMMMMMMIVFLILSFLEIRAERRQKSISVEFSFATFFLLSRNVALK